MQEAVVITGATGGIGKALCIRFAKSGWKVIATSQQEEFDKAELEQSISDNIAYIPEDLNELASSDDALNSFLLKLQECLKDIPLKALINNGAVQILGSADTDSLDALSKQDFTTSINVNLIAPFLLVQALLPMLKASKGSVLNIGSVHAIATKPGFAAYATSKSALHGLTRALAVDLGGKIRVNTLAPAATATPMLMAGFEGKKEAFAQLEATHPVKRIATPEEISDIAQFLVSDAAGFLTGSAFYADGGILSRLHDPV
jgi:NAD(P)-dependent dehydrogenase (short-subunit alcohol dehydrogenase family)